MHYTENSQGSCYIPKLLGVYERELHDVLENLIAWGPDLVIDAGAAEGYYAVGLARRLPQSRIMAFEMEEGGRASRADGFAERRVGSRRGAG
jgi:predicted O-methyltransferase YrrM